MCWGQWKWGIRQKDSLLTRVCVSKTSETPTVPLFPSAGVGEHCTGQGVLTPMHPAGFPAPKLPAGLLCLSQLTLSTSPISGGADLTSEGPLPILPGPVTLHSDTLPTLPSPFPRGAGEGRSHLCVGANHRARLVADVQ
jgi:hypothetical protein